MKGVVLAGGEGRRLGARTRARGKSLLPVGGRAMVFYPLVTLMRSGVRRIVLVTSPRDQPEFQALLGDGHQWGIELEYAEQYRPGGLAHALLAAAPAIDGEACALILGDNLFLPPPDLREHLRQHDEGALVFATRVDDVSAFGAVSLDTRGHPVALVEKPERSSGALAVPGFYVYDASACDRASTLRPSGRGELEITDLNRRYLEAGTLRVQPLPSEVDWIDAGTPAGLERAEQRVTELEQLSGHPLALPAAVALEQRYLSREALREQLANTTNSTGSTDRTHLERLLSGEG